MFVPTLRKAFFPVLFLAAAAAPVGAADPPDSLAFVYDDGAGNTMPYRLFVPPGYDPGIRYPLVLFLHGAGECGTDNLAQIANNIDDLIAHTQSERFASFLLAPQAPNTDVAWYEWSTVLLDGLIHEVLASYPNIDERRLYVTGLSMGGFGTLWQIYTFPERFAAAVPISSGIPADQAAYYAAFFWQVPMWVFHGTLDTVVSVDYSRALVQALRDAGGDPLYTEYPDRGHDAWFPAYADAEDQFYPWLFSQNLNRPIAQLVLSQTTGEAPLEVCPSAEGSTPEEGAQLILFEWDFGDGATGEGVAPCHTYTDAGDYIIRLTVTSDLGSSGSKTAKVLVHCGREDVTPWAAADIGGPVLHGAARLTEGGSGMAICAGGKLLGGGQDSIHLVHRQVQGDFSISGRITGLTEPMGQSQVGVMFRESLEPNARGAAESLFHMEGGAYVTRLQARTAPGGALKVIFGSISQAQVPAVWVRISRLGEEFIGYFSSDGSSWKEAGRQSIPGLPETCYAGIVAAGAEALNQTSGFRPILAEFAELSLVDCESGGDPVTVIRLIEIDDCPSSHLATVTLSARNVATPAAITERLPIASGGTGASCGVVIDAGGGKLEKDRILFTLASDGDVSYRVDLTGCSSAAGSISFRGDVAGGSGCLKSVAGDTSIPCPCPCEGDTLCTGLVVTDPEGGGPGTYRASASAEDASGDPILYFFKAEDGLGLVLTAGPQVENSAEFELGEGTWTISVLVDDDPSCGDSGSADSCRAEVVVSPPYPRFLRADPNDDGLVDISDGVFILNWLFTGGREPGCAAAANANGDGLADISDGVYILNHLFLGGPSPAAPFPGCGPGTLPDDEALGCRTAPRNCPAP